METTPEGFKRRIELTRSRGKTTLRFPIATEKNDYCTTRVSFVL
jgi:hypothetical protein